MRRAQNDLINIPGDLEVDEKFLARYLGTHGNPSTV